MAITALPAGTVHLLGSAQVLTTPTSLVKELIDNALDAKATSIDILISPNTLDKIEVRDNGHGIPPEDLDALGRRGYTSKLRSFDELKSIGGISLGFRGEALASAVQLGEVLVTTKTEGETVATAVKLKVPGGIERQNRTSHPVGTTVCVLNFMSQIPVRKQTALKESGKTLVKIKELLQSYALARPNIRFSMKIIKCSKGSCCFAPRPNDGIKETVSQVIGREATIECFEKILSFPGPADNSDIAPGLITLPSDSESTGEVPRSIENHFVVELFLPRPDADFSKVGHGQYLSVDSRPVSHDKGTMKRIVTMFKSYVKTSFVNHSEKPKSPFLRLNIKCPIGSYDPNVEPAKDDVLFGNEYLVLESIEHLFKGIYGDYNVVNKIPSRQKLYTPDEFDLLLAETPATPSETHAPLPPTSFVTIEHDSPIIQDNEYLNELSDGATTRKLKFDTFQDYNRTIDTSRIFNHQSLKTGSAQCQDLHQQSNLEGGLNPWIIAKLNNPVRDDTSHVSSSSIRSEIPHCAEDLPTTQHLFDPPSDNLEDSTATAARPRHSSHRDRLTAVPIPNLSSRSQQNQGFAASTMGTRLHRRSLDSESENEHPGDINDTGTLAGRNDFVSANTLASTKNTEICAPQMPMYRKSKGINKPFVPPKHVVENYAQNNLKQTTLIDYDSAQGQATKRKTSLDQELNLAWAMEFERRKEIASRRRREELNAARQRNEIEPGDIPRSSPHKNRYSAAIATFEADQPLVRISKVATKAPFEASLPNDESRAYSSKQKSTPGKPVAVRKMSLAKLQRLPLETTPADGKLYDVVETISTTVKNLRRDVLELTKVDRYATYGEQIRGLEINASDMRTLTANLQAVVDRWNKAGTVGKEYGIKYTFENLLNLQ